MASKKTGKRRTLKIPGWIALPISAAVLLIAAALYFVLPDFGDDPHLTDQELISNFQAHRTDFDRLLEMILQDQQLTRVDRNWTEPRDPSTIGVASARIDEYRRVFRRLGIKSGFSSPQTRESIELLTSTQGWVSHGSEKGYLYTKRPSDHYGGLLDSLDSYTSQQRTIGAGCRHIEGNWYLYFSGD